MHELKQVYVGAMQSVPKAPYAVNTVNETVENSKREPSTKRSLINNNTEIQQIFSQMHLPPQESRHYNQETRAISHNETLEFQPYEAQNHPGG